MGARLVPSGLIIFNVHLASLSTITTSTLVKSIIPATMTGALSIVPADEVALKEMKKEKKEKKEKTKQVVGSEVEASAVTQETEAAETKEEKRARKEAKKAVSHLAPCLGLPAHV